MHAPVQRSRDLIRLSAARRSITYGVGAGLWLTGVLWLIFHYFMQRQTDFGAQPHPLEFWWRASHGFFGFASLWTFGLLWGAHIVGAWKSRRHRLSGGLLFGILVWLTGSGYLLYYLGSDELISTVSLLHWSVGLILPVPFIVHRFTRRTATDIAIRKGRSS